MIKANYLVILPPTQQCSFFRNLPPLGVAHFTHFPTTPSPLQVIIAHSLIMYVLPVIGVGFVPQPLRKYISPQAKYCTESLVVHEDYNQLFQPVFLLGEEGDNYCNHLEMERVFGSCIQGVLKFIDTFWYTFSGKRKPWSGILLYGVRHLYAICLDTFSFCFLIQSYQSCMFNFWYKVTCMRSKWVYPVL